MSCADRSCVRPPHPPSSPVLPVCRLLRLACAVSADIPRLPDQECKTGSVGCQRAAAVDHSRRSPKGAWRQPLTPRGTIVLRANQMMCTVGPGDQSIGHFGVYVQPGRGDPAQDPPDAQLSPHNNNKAGTLSSSSHACTGRGARSGKPPRPSLSLAPPRLTSLAPSQALELAHRLSTSKIPVVASTASATLRQLFMFVFERVSEEDTLVAAASADPTLLPFLPPPSFNLDVPPVEHDAAAAVMPEDGQAGSEAERGSTSIALRPAARDAYLLLEDLCLLISGSAEGGPDGEPSFLRWGVLSRTFGLELVESIVAGFGGVVRKVSCPPSEVARRWRS